MYEKLSITVIYNVSYSPEFNPIESAFSNVKRKFNQQRLNALANKESFNLDRGIQNAFTVITPELIRNCAKRSYAKLVNLNK